MLNVLRKRIYRGINLFCFDQEVIGNIKCCISLILKEIRRIISFDTFFGNNLLTSYEIKINNPKINTGFKQFLGQLAGFGN